MWRSAQRLPPPRGYLGLEAPSGPTTPKRVVARLCADGSVSEIQRPQPVPVWLGMGGGLPNVGLRTGQRWAERHKPPGLEGMRGARHWSEVGAEVTRLWNRFWERTGLGWRRRRGQRRSNALPPVGGWPGRRSEYGEGGVAQRPGRARRPGERQAQQPARCASAPAPSRSAGTGPPGPAGPAPGPLPPASVLPAQPRQSPRRPRR